MRKSLPPDELLLGELWSRFKTGDQHAFNQLVTYKYRTLFRFASRLTSDHDCISDCLQDLFMELWTRRETISTTSYVSLYLMKALRNNLIRKINRERARNNQIMDLETAHHVSDYTYKEEELIYQEGVVSTEQNLQYALNQLGKRQQEAIFLKFYQGLSNEAIAQHMDVEKQTVANFLFRGLTQLRKELHSSY